MKRFYQFLFILGFATFLLFSSALFTKKPLIISEPISNGLGPKHTIYVAVACWNRGKVLKEIIADVDKLWLEKNAENIQLHLQFRDDEFSLQEIVGNATVPILASIVHSPFSRGGWLQKVYDNVRNDEKGILFLLDADMTIPNDLFHQIRRSVHPQRTFFTPIIAYLNQEGEIENFGMEGYGMIAASIADINRAGGAFSPEMIAKTSWGGEDENFRDRLWALGLQAVRFKYPKFQHKWHSKVGKWYNKPTGMD